MWIGDLKHRYFLRHLDKKPESFFFAKVEYHKAAMMKSLEFFDSSDLPYCYLTLRI